MKLGSLHFSLHFSVCCSQPTGVRNICQTKYFSARSFGIASSVWRETDRKVKWERDLSSLWRYKRVHDYLCSFIVRPKHTPDTSLKYMKRYLPSTYRKLYCSFTSLIETRFCSRCTGYQTLVCI